MNNTQTFTADTAKKLASDRKEIMKKRTETLADSIVNHVKVVYSGEVQKAISNNIYCHSINIKIPKECRKALLKLSGNEYSILKDSVDRRLSANGFTAELQQNSWSCDDCLFKYMACTKYYNIHFSWR